MQLGRAGACLLIAVVYLTLRLVVPWSDLAHLSPTAAMLGSMALLMLAQLAFVVSIAGLRLRRGYSAALLLLMGAAVVGLTALEVGLMKQGSPPGHAFTTVSVLGDVCLMAFAALIGYAVSFIVREPNIIVPAAVFAALVDYWSVSWGPLSHILEKKPEVVEAVSVQMPTAAPGVSGAPGATIGMIGMVGMGDFVFLALFFGVIYRFAMNARGTFLLAYVLLTISMLLVLRFGGALPALVPIALAVVGANARYFKLKREELLATSIVGFILLAVLILSGVFLFRR